MLTFYLVRHGLKDAIPFDPPLTEIGLKQAELTAEKLKDIKFEAVYVSPKLRTQQTAKIITAPHNLSLNTDDKLIERLEWEKDESFEKFVDEWIKTDIDRNYVPRIGKSSNENGVEVKKFIDELSDKYKEGNILIVTHGGTIGDLLRNIFGEENLPHAEFPVTHTRFIEILECSITVIQKEEGKYSLVGLGDISHLDTPLI